MIYKHNKLSSKPTPLPFIAVKSRIFAVILFALLAPCGVFAQYTISGRVINQADTRPIADCSVFLSNATNGAKTTNDGKFMLSGVKPGKYTLVVSFVGYDTYSQPVAVVDGDIILPDITLFPKTITLSAVTIKPDLNRGRNFDWFKEEFLGPSELAKQCKILNPEVIGFTYDEKAGVLTASSSDFIEIENQGLGYRVKYLLKNFVLNNKDGNAKKLQFDGSVLFEKMKGTPAQERRWQKRREEVYLNSSMHFLRAVLSNRLAAEGFRATQIAYYKNPARPDDSVISIMVKKYEKLKEGKGGWRDSLSFWNAKTKLPKMLQTHFYYPLTAKDLVYPTDMPGLMALGCAGDKIQVDYNKNARFPANNSANSETTILSFNEPYTFFDINGGIFNTGSVSFAGAWGRNRMAELLPVDFEPAATVDKPVVAGIATAGQGAVNGTLSKIAAIADSLNKKAAIEKLYLQFDKPYYALNDTIWFKAYLLNTTYLSPSAKSGFLYVDIMNDSSKVVTHYKFRVGDGLCCGNIALNGKEFTPGTYMLHAYTNWMRNYGDECFFTKQFYVSDAGESSLLVNSNISQSKKDGLDMVDAKLLFSDINKTPYALKTLQMQVLAGNKVLHNNKLSTGVDGALDVKFSGSKSAGNLAMIVTSEQKDKKAIIPVPLSRPENMDVQFLPEGGIMVTGQTAHIGFKAIGENGRAIDISGTIVNQDQKQVAEIRSLHNGMGSFDMAVKTGETYTAKISVAGDVVKSIALPAAKSSGTVLNIKNDAENDSLEVIIAASADIASTGNSYFLTGSARGIVCYAATVNFNRGSRITNKVSKSLFPSGIAHFKLMTTAQQPLNERAVFINRDENLHISLKTDKPAYAVRDSIGLKIKVTGDNGKPVNGSYSLAVTDDGQVKTDTLNDENILSRFLLTADLKGYIEQPGYYFTSKSTGVQKALDNLLLTQGWISYDVDRPAKFEAETQFAVSGRVSNVFNKPVNGSKVLLFSKSPRIIRDTLTGEDGRFRFADLPAIDTPLFIMQAVNKRGKSFNVNVSVNEVAPPEFNISKQPVMMPWYVNSDTTLLNYAKIHKLAREQEFEPDGSHILKEVKITAKKFIKDSQNLNGPGNADFVLDEKELEKQGKKTFLDILTERVKGFRLFYYKDSIKYMVDDLGAWFIIDGYDLGTVLPDEDIKHFLTSHNAEDIKGIEVNTSGKNTVNYYRRFCPDCMLGSIAFIEITTRSGNGQVISSAPGVYLYKSQPVSWPKQFYKPKYAIKPGDKPLPDLRSTITWEPNIVTDTNGEASVWFYSAGKPSTYTIVVEGTDLTGDLGRIVQKIKIDGNLQ